MCVVCVLSLFQSTGDYKSKFMNLHGSVLLSDRPVRTAIHIFLLKEN